MIAVKPGLYALPPKSYRNELLVTIYDDIYQQLEEKGKFSPEGWGGIEMVRSLKGLFALANYEFCPLTEVATSLELTEVELSQMIVRDTSDPLNGYGYAGYDEGYALVFPVTAKPAFVIEKRWTKGPDTSLFTMADRAVLRVMSGEVDVTSQCSIVQMNRLVQLDWSLGSSIRVIVSKDSPLYVEVGGEHAPQPTLTSYCSDSPIIKELFADGFTEEMIKALSLPRRPYMVKLPVGHIHALERIGDYS